MKAKAQSKTKLSKPRWKKILLIVSALFVTLVVFVFLIIPMFISSDQGRRLILAKINNSIDGQTDFSDLSVGWLKGIRIADLSFKDDVGQISVKVKNITTKPHYGSLLTGNINLGQTNIDMPQVEINLKDGLPATSTPSGTEVKSVPKESAGIALITDIRVNDGSVKVTGADSKTVELEQINSNVNLRPPGQQSSLDLDMVIAANNEKSTVKANAQITPSKSKGWTFKGATGGLNVTVNKLDIESLGPLLALANIDVQAKGDISVDLKGQLQNGQLENLSGTVKGSNIDIGGEALKGDSIKTKVLDASVKLSRKEKMINIDNLNMKTDWANIDASGELPTTINSLDSLLASDSKSTLNASFNCNVAELASQMPITLGLKEGTTISSGNINGNINTLDSGGKKQIQAIAQLSDLKGLVEGKQVSLSAPVKLDALVSPDQSGININKLDLTASFASLDCSGNLKSIKYNAKTDLTKLQSELGQFVKLGQYRMAGAFGSDGTVSISEEAISAAGVMQLDNLQLSSEGKGSVSEQKATMNFDMDFDRKDNVITAKNIKANAGFGQVDIKDAKVRLQTGSTIPVDATVLASNIDLSKLKPYAIMFSSLPKEMNISGIAQSEILVSTQKQTYIIKSDSTKITNLKLTYPEKKPFAQDDVSFKFVGEIDTQAETYGVNGFELISPDIKIDYGTLSQTSKDDKTTLKGQVSCEFNWSAVSALASDFLPDELTLKGQRKDKISFSSEYPLGEPNKLLPNLNANAFIGFQEASYKGLDVGPTDVNIAVKNGLLEIAPFSTTVNEGQLNFAANADFKEKPALFKTNKPMQIVKDIKINDEMTRKLLKYINPIFAEAVNVHGIANFNCEVLSIPLDSAAKDKAEIVGTVSISQLQMQTSDFLSQLLKLFGGGVRGTIITIHPTRFSLLNGFLRYEDMQMDVGDNPVNFKGVIGLDKSLDMTVTLPYTTEGRTIRVGEQNARRITLPITGTVDNPQLDMGKLLENQFKQELPNLLQKGLEELFK